MDRPVFPRSAYKMLQALPLIETGAADAYGLANHQLALACASHNSEPGHVDAVTDWLETIGCMPDHLACGAHRPYHLPSADALLLGGDDPDQRHNNCSGKHSGFLTVARHLGVYPEGYHPVQRHAIGAICDMTGISEGDMTVGIDGCSAPALAFPLTGMARALARLSRPDVLPGARGDAARRLFTAVTKEPWYVAGTDRACTVLMQTAGGRASLKTGAEAVYTAVIPEKGLGIALKINDGNGRGSECAIASVLCQLGVLDPANPRVAKFANPVLKNVGGIEVGAIRPAPALAEFIV